MLESIVTILVLSLAVFIISQQLSLSYINLYFIQDQACQDSLYTSSSIKESKESGWGKA